MKGLAIVTGEVFRYGALKLPLLMGCFLTGQVFPTYLASSTETLHWISFAMAKGSWPPMLYPVAVSSAPWDDGSFSVRAPDSLPPPLNSLCKYWAPHFGAPDLYPDSCPGFAHLIPPPLGEFGYPCQPESTACHYPPPHFSALQSTSNHFVTQSFPLLTGNSLPALGSPCLPGIHSTAGLHMQHMLSQEASALLSQPKQHADEGIIKKIQQLNSKKSPVIKSANN